MHVIHRGLTIELADGDPRVKVIEAVLFAPELPPSVAAFGQPKTHTPDSWRKFWKKLKIGHRRELVLLAERRWRPEELEAELGITQPKLRGYHQSIHAYAKKFGVPVRIRTYGRVRKDRSYALTDAGKELVTTLSAPTS